MIDALVALVAAVRSSVPDPWPLSLVFAVEEAERVLADERHGPNLHA